MLLERQVMLPWNVGEEEEACAREQRDRRRMVLGSLMEEETFTNAIEGPRMVLL